MAAPVTAIDAATAAPPGGMLGHLRRVTTSGSYLPEIDGLRFIAIWSVVAVHVWGYWNFVTGHAYPAMSAWDRGLERLVSLGGYGVHLFFMISGFVLAMPFCRHALLGGRPVNLRNYFVRRITRLEPPYVISMLAFFVLMPLAGKGTWAELWPHLLASLGYVHNIVYGDGSVLNNNAWSLEVEVQFYLLMPLIAAVLWLPPAARRSILAVAAVALSAHPLWLPTGCPQSVLQFGQFFLMGILLCDIWTTRWKDLPRTASADLPGIAAWPAFAAVNLGYPGVVADLATPWLIALLFFSALRGALHSRVLAYPPVSIIGGMCYSIYLLHARAIAATIHGGLGKLSLSGSFGIDYPIVFAACAGTVLAVSMAYYVTIERPCMDPDWPTKAARWLGRWFRGRPVAETSR